tara:strand:+ start:286 stop:672 length:387 start_codon:yes stop_codon:yes gene_type:complete
MSADNLVLFLDSIGRTVIGNRDSETKTVLKVKNPSVLHVVPNQENGQIQVQLIPVFFKEFADPNSPPDTVWDYLKANITLATNVKLDARLCDQYNNMYSVIQTPDTPQLVGAGAGAASDAPVVKLFDD